MKGVILHGGHGTRLRPLTHTGPKQLLPIANRPMSEYCLDSIKETGITDIAIITGEHKSAIENHFRPVEKLEKILEKEPVKRVQEFITQFYPNLKVLILDTTARTENDEAKS